MEWTAFQIREALSKGQAPENIRICTSVGTLRDKAAEWIYEARDYTSMKPEAIRKGYEHTGTSEVGF